MELNKELYKRTFSRLKVSPAIGKELLAMTEKARKPKKFVLRRVIVAAAALALAVALAMGANAASGGELADTVLDYVRSSITIPDDGSVVVITEGKDGEAWISIEKNEEAGDSGDVTVTVDDSEADGAARYTVTEYDGESSTVVESGEIGDFTAEKSPEAEVSSAPETSAPEK